MRPIPTASAGRSCVLALALAAGGTLGCDLPTGTGPVRALDIAAPSTQLRPGFLMRAEATPLDGAGNPLAGYVATWRSLTPQTLEVSPDGLMLAHAPGVGIARATVNGVSAELRLDLVNPPIAHLALDADTLRLFVPIAEQRQLVATAKDAAGIGIVGAPLTWESSAPRIASVSASGVVTPVAVGRSTVTVYGDGQARSVTVLVAAQASPTAPVITGLSSGALAPGQTVVLSGTGFARTPAGNGVLLDGVPVAVTAASPTQLTLALPGAAAFPCQAAADVALQVTVAGSIGVAPVRLTTAPTRALAVGQSQTFLTAGDARCHAFAPGRYLLTIPNASRALGTGAIALTVRGVAVPAAGANLVAGARPPVRPPTTLRAGRGALADARSLLGAREARARAAAHWAMLERNVAVGQQAGRPAAALRAPGAAAVSAPALGQVLPLRVPAIEGPGFCNEYTPIGARVVHVGDHVVLLEDTSSVLEGQPTLARQMDADYAALGTELEARGWPILQQFGDPLVMDPRLDDNGRVLVVFTPRMNRKLGGAVLATVVNCDFYPRATFASSNVGEYVYAQAPMLADASLGPGTRGQWRHEMRATLVHEMKHVTSYAERNVRGQPLEEPWLEEALARHAEELWARATYGFARGANVGFAASLACELRAGDPAFPACADAPRAMRPHLEALWRFLETPTDRSPLGPIDPGDVTFYGSAWALTRWWLDQDGLVEPATFAALTTSRLSGVANLEARGLGSWDAVLAEWSLALVVDDRPGFAPQSSRLRFPSFDLRSLYQGLCDVAGSCLSPAPTPWGRPWPVQPIALGTGPIATEIPAIVPAGFAVLELVVEPTAAVQVLELTGFRGLPLPGATRLAVVRVE